MKLSESIDKTVGFFYSKIRLLLLKKINGIYKSIGDLSGCKSRKYMLKAENEKVEKGNVTERRCHRLKASFTGNFLKCIRELIR